MAPPDAHDSWIDLVQLRSLADPVSIDPPRQKRNWRALAWLFLLVVVPTVLAGCYFGLLAPDRYVAEARFIVRKPASISSTTMAPVSPEQTLQSGDEDAYAVRDFILSRDGMQAMLDHGGLRAAIARSGPDPVWRFPGFLNGDTDEQLYRYYQAITSVTHEASTGVTTLRMEAFDPEDARRLAAGLADAGEALLNQLQVRARQDAIRVATGEVERSRALATEAQLGLTDFRTRESMIDPALLAETVLKTITALSLQVVEAGAQRDLLRHTSASSPQISPLTSRITALQAQIDRERGSLAGTEASFAPKVAEYERLVLLRDFAVRNFLASLTSLESARLEALHQRAYLERVVQPRAADRPAYPYRVVWVLVVFGVGMLAWRMFRPSDARYR
jgi:capsular polysaccharide transport system permease protein